MGINTVSFNLRSLTSLVMPSVIMIVFVSAYQLVDGIFIAKYVNDVAIAAANLYSPIIYLIVAVGLMLGNGGNAAILYAAGKGDMKEASRLLSQTILTGVIFTGIITAALILFADPIMILLGGLEGNMAYLRPYYLIMSTCTVGILFQSVAASFLIGEGKSSLAAGLIISGGVTNIALDYLFMAVFHWGITGAAVATVIGYMIPVLAAAWFYLIRKKSVYCFQLTGLEWGKIGQICLNGSSDMVSNLASSITGLIMNRIAAAYWGELGESAISAVLYLPFLAEAIFMGFCTATEPAISYYYGSENTGLMHSFIRKSLLWIAGVSAALFAVLELSAPVIAGMFFSSGTEVFELTRLGILLGAWACLFIGMNVFTSSMFTAFSNGLVSGFLSLMRSFGFLTAVLLLLVRIIGTNGLWLAWPVAEALSFILSVWAYERYRKRYHY